MMKKISLYFDREKGEMFLDDVKSIMLNRGGQSSTNSDFERIAGPVATTVIYGATKDAGRSIALSAYDEKFSKKQLVLRLLDQLLGRGYGTPDLIFWNEEKFSFRIRVKKCFSATNRKDSKKPVCYWMSGILAGAFESIFNRGMRCVETKCESMGNPYCEFEIKPDKDTRIPKRKHSTSISKENLEKFEVSFNEKTGEIHYKGTSSEIHSRDQIALFQKEFGRIIGPATRGVMYDIYKKSALRVVTNVEKILIKTLGIFSKRFFAEELAKTQIAPRGFGVGWVESLDEKKPFVIMRVKNCFNAMGYKNSRKPVCYAMSGIFAGAGTIVFGREMECIETKCIAMGDEFCEFEVFSRSRILSLERILDKLKSTGYIEDLAIIANDGMLLASRLEQDIDANVLSAISGTIIGSADKSMIELGKVQAHKIIVETSKGKLILMKAGRNANLITFASHDAALGLILNEMEKACREIEKEYLFGYSASES